MRINVDLRTIERRAEATTIDDWNKNSPRGSQIFVSNQLSNSEIVMRKLREDVQLLANEIRRLAENEEEAVAKLRKFVPCKSAGTCHGCPYGQTVYHLEK